MLAPGADDARSLRQRELLSGEEAGLADRDVETLHHYDAQTRERYGVTADGFAAVLIGRDGGEKLRSTEPVSAALLFGTIDAMPVRRREMREGHERGSGARR